MVKWPVGVTQLGVEALRFELRPAEPPADPTPLKADGSPLSRSGTGPRVRASSLAQATQPGVGVRGVVRTLCF